MSAVKRHQRDGQPVPGLYRHHKGQFYLVHGIAEHTETSEPFVVCQALYGAGALWVRPRSMFLESVRVNDREAPRFELVGESRLLRVALIRKVLAWRLRRRRPASEHSAVTF
jgi:hypothetical protein